MKRKVLLIVLLTGMLVLSSCSFGGARNDQSDQVRALETQNALLAKQIDQIQQNLQDKQDETGSISLPEPSESESVQAEQAQKEPEKLPTEPVKAGVPIVFDGWRLIVSSEVSTDSNDRVGVKIFLENLSEQKRIFRFTNAAVTIGDDLGTDYPMSIRGSEGFSRYDCEPYLHKVKNLEIRGENTKEIYSSLNSCGYDYTFNKFEGPIPISAKKIYVYLNDFGPFTGITAVIDL
jgi:outer membrane murein-binding lipoprotein Lpp